MVNPPITQVSATSGQPSEFQEHTDRYDAPAALLAGYDAQPTSGASCPPSNWPQTSVPAAAVILLRVRPSPSLTVENQN